MLGLRTPELLIILVVFVLLFGSKKLPELGDSLGKGIRAFKKASDAAFADDGSQGATPKGQLPQGSVMPTPSSAPVERTEA